MMDSMPAPPGFIAGVDLNGPYDKDIPPAKSHQIKSASLVADWAVPYIFLSVACRFEAEGDENRSIAFYDRAYSEFRKRKNVYGEGTAWRWKMAALQRFGHDADAFKSINEMGTRSSGAPLIPFVLYGVGHYHAEIGDYAQAIDYFRKALDANTNYAGNPDLTLLRRDTELECGMAILAADYFPAAAGKLFRAELDEIFYRNIRSRIALSLTHLEKVQGLNLELSQMDVNRYLPDILPPYIECDLQNYLGLAMGIQGDTDKAIDYLDKAAEIARQSGYHLGKADNVFFLSQIYLLNKNRVEGKKAAYALQNAADQYQLLPYAAWAKILLAHHERHAGSIDSALKFILDFLDLMDKNALWLSSVSDFRGTRHFESLSLYHAVFDLFVEHGDRKNAFKMAESIKAIPLVAAFRTADWGEKSAEGQIIQKFRSNREEAAGVYRRLLSVTNSTPVFLKTVQSAERLQKEAHAILSDMKNQHVTLYRMNFVDPPDAGEIYRQLDRNTTLFSYYSTAQALYVWVISRNGIHMEKLKMTGSDLEKLVSDHALAVALKDRGQIDALAEKAYEALLQPVVRFMNGDRIVFIPHGALSRFPFATMRYMNAYLVDVFSIYYLPCAGMMKNAEPGGGVSKKSLMIAGSRANREALAARTDAAFESLTHFYPQTDYAVQTENPKEALMKMTGHYEVMYYASECYLTDRTPLGSGFLLSATAKLGGYAAISDLLKLSVRGRISVIGSCLNGNTPSAVVGSRNVLVSSLLYASTPAVLMPLWSDDEKARGVLMEHFYKHLGKNEDAADALKEAQNDMIRSGAGPSEWGAFILFSRN